MRHNIIGVVHDITISQKFWPTPSFPEMSAIPLSEHFPTVKQAVEAGRYHAMIVLHINTKQSLSIFARSQVCRNQIIIVVGFSVP